MTSREVLLVELLADAWNEYVKLPIEHPMEREEFCRAIHAAQDIVLSRCGRRSMSASGTGVVEVVDPRDHP